MPIVNDKIKADMRKKAMDVFGGNFDEIIIGGAPFNADVERFLKQIGFPYTIAYGMTECGPIICSSRWETLKLASCGKATTRRLSRPSARSGRNYLPGNQPYAGLLQECRSHFSNNRRQRLAAHRRPCHDGCRRLCHRTRTQ